MGVEEMKVPRLPKGRAGRAGGWVGPEEGMNGSPFTSTLLCVYCVCERERERGGVG